MITPLVKGKFPSLLSTELANEIIQQHNAIENLQVKVVGGSGKFSIKAGTAQLLINPRATTTEATPDHPLKVMPQSGNLVSVVPGTIGGRWVTVAGRINDGSQTIAATSTGEIIASCAVVEEQLTSANITFAKSLPRNTPTRAYVTLAKVTVRNGQIEKVDPSVSGSLGFARYFADYVFIGV
jgi:hypothetical protein